MADIRCETVSMCLKRWVAYASILISCAHACVHSIVHTRRRKMKQHSLRVGAKATCRGAGSWELVLGWHHLGLGEVSVYHCLFWFIYIIYAYMDVFITYCYHNHWIVRILVCPLVSSQVEEIGGHFVRGPFRPKSWDRGRKCDEDCGKAAKTAKPAAAPKKSKSKILGFIIENIYIWMYNIYIIIYVYMYYIYILLKPCAIIPECCPFERAAAIITCVAILFGCIRCIEMF
jgi:hypothetical protein